MKQITRLNLETRKFFNYTDLQYMIDTLLENPRLGRIFVDDDINPNTCIISLKHLLFFGGNLTKECLDFLSNKILTDDIRDRKSIFFMLYPNEDWMNSIMGLFPNRCYQYERSLYSIKPTHIDRQSSYDNIEEITPELITSTTNNLDMITDEIIGTGTYNDMEDFFNRGIGYTLVINNKVSGFCTSEYPSKDAIAIGIEVSEEYQKQGYAKAMTKLFLNKAAQNGLTVYWECWKNNIASANTALSCQFEKVADYPFIFVEL
ncbi:GNAT family N-acetyltransferase [Tissierella sp.]|uniref:GNAT family N-acetyltransferase n=1 Tax=Tissierella sp. TaxID=41274 RepID=UPI0028661C09|nr:GNAT family N-acetyltransferase [Tissierella sp.]MDR7857887.1 GNAT family N-acetyltransferase [Tissierella sp.]